MDKNLKVAIILSAVDKATAVLDKSFANAEAKATRLSKATMLFNNIGANMMIGGAAITGFFANAVDEAQDAAKAIRVMDAAYSNLGKRGAEIAKQGQEFAEKYQLKIGINDENIEAVQTKFAPFQRMFTDTAMKAKLMERATKLAFDMDASGFGDAAGNAAKLGMLMNDPINNINKMGKVLGKVDAQTKQHVQTLLSQNKMTEAQQYLLGLVEKRFNKHGSAAEAAATPTSKFKTAVHELSVKMGNALLPQVNEAITKFSDYLPLISKFIDNHKGLILNVAKAGLAMLAFGGTMRLVSGTLAGFTTIGKIAGGVIGGGKFVAGLFGAGQKALEAGEKISSFTKAGLMVRGVVSSSIIPALKAASTSMLEFGATLLASPVTWFVAAAVAIGVAAYLIYKHWDKISVWFKNLWAKTKVVFTQAWEWIKNMFLNYTPQGLIIKHWDKIVSWFKGLWTDVKNVFNGWIDWVMGLGARFVDAGKNIVMSIWAGIKSMAHKPIQAIEEIVSKMRDFLPFSPAKVGPFRDLHRVKIIETIAQSMKPAPAIAAMRRVTGGLYNVATSPASVTTGGGNATFNFSPVVHLHGGATQKDADKLTREMKELLTRWWRDMEANNSRTSFNQH